MSPIPSVSFAPRLRRGLLMCLAAVIMTLTVGCGQRRQAMRPVFATPIPAGVPCRTPAATVIDEPTTSSSTSTSSSVVDDEPTAVTNPAGGLSAPAAPRDSSANPASTSPPRPSAPGSDEPGYLKSNDSSSGSSVDPPQLQGPKSPTSLRGNVRESSGRVRQAGLRQGVRPFVNDPDDLFSPPKADRPWKYVVLHHSAKPSGNYDQIDREHRKVLGWDGCGYHFVIGNGNGSPDGQIEVARRWTEQKNGVHCRDGKTPEVNEYGIGICLIGDLDEARPTPKQVASAKALVAYLSERYQIPNKRVETHSHLAASPTVCPGKHFPASEILSSAGLARR